MNKVIQYNSKEKFVKVILKDGDSFGEVKIHPDEFDPYSRWHVIERKNGDVEFIMTREIQAIMFI